MTSLVFCLLLATVLNAQQHENLPVDPAVMESSGPAIYPNPTVDVVYIEHIRPVTEVVILNLVGQVIEKFETNRKQYYILDLTELHNGMYFIRVTDTNNIIHVQKIIKQ